MKSTMVMGGLLAIVCGALGVGCSSAQAPGDGGDAEATGATSSEIIAQYGLLTNSGRDWYCVDSNGNRPGTTVIVRACAGSQTASFGWIAAHGATYEGRLPGLVALNGQCITGHGNGGWTTVQACNAADANQKFYRDGVFLRAGWDTTQCFTIQDYSNADGKALAVATCQETLPRHPAQSFNWQADGWDARNPLNATLSTSLRIVRAVEQQLVNANRGGERQLAIGYNGSSWYTNSGADQNKRIASLLNTAFTLPEASNVWRCWSGKDGSAVNDMFAITASKFTDGDVVPGTATLGAATGSGAIGAYVTDADSGIVFRTGRLALAWRYRANDLGAAQRGRDYATDFINRLGQCLSRAKDPYGTYPWPLDVHLQPASSWGYGGNNSEYITFDPPTDGITPSSVTGSSTGSGTIAVASPSNGCVTANDSLLYQPCVLQAFTGELPNFVTTATVVPNGDGTTVSYPAYWIDRDTTTRPVLRCSSGYKCKMH
jgi:hypothetical protein